MSFALQKLSQILSYQFDFGSEQAVFEVETQKIRGLTSAHFGDSKQFLSILEEIGPNEERHSLNVAEIETLVVANSCILFKLFSSEVISACDSIVFGILQHGISNKLRLHDAFEVVHGLYQILVVGEHESIGFSDSGLCFLVIGIENEGAQILRIFDESLG